MRPETDADGLPRSRRARYTAGRLASGGGARGGEAPDYAAEPGADPDRGSETWAEVCLRIDTPRWRGTRVVLRAGKALAHRRKGVFVRFQPGDGAARDGISEQLWIDIDGPDEIDLELIGRTLGPPARDAAVQLSGPPVAASRSPYAYVLADLLSGGSRLSIRGDEAEAAGRVLEPVMASWRRGRGLAGGLPGRLRGPDGQRRLMRRVVGRVAHVDGVLARLDRQSSGCSSPRRRTGGSSPPGRW